MRFEHIVVFIIGPLAGYLLGSIPFALLIGLANGVDIRKVGSGNIGATNLGRTLGSHFFMHAFLLDAAKGLVPTLAIALLVRSWNNHPGHPHLGGDGGSVQAWAPMLTAVACVVGHLLSIFLKFKGGKGVATTFGVLLGFWPIFTLAGLGGALVFMLVFLGWRYISLSSIIGSLAFPLLVIWVGRTHNDHLDTYLHWHELWPMVVAAGAMCAMILWKHRANMARLRAGTELKAGRSGSKTDVHLT